MGQSSCGQLGLGKSTRAAFEPRLVPGLPTIRHCLAVKHATVLVSDAARPDVLVAGENLAHFGQLRGNQWTFAKVGLDSAL